jgi:Kef-type K+ transport system membrane component KefB
MIGQLVIAAAFVSDFLTLLISSVLKTAIAADHITVIAVVPPLIWAILYLLLFIFLALKVVPKILKKIIGW